MPQPGASDAAHAAPAAPEEAAASAGALPPDNGDVPAAPEDTNQAQAGGAATSLPSLGARLPSLGAPLPGVVGPDLLAAGVAAAQEAPAEPRPGDPVRTVGAPRRAPAVGCAADSGPPRQAPHMATAAPPPNQATVQIHARNGSAPEALASAPATTGARGSVQESGPSLNVSPSSGAAGSARESGPCLDPNSGNAAASGAHERGPVARARARAAATKARWAEAAEARAGEARAERTRALPARLGALALSRNAAGCLPAPLRAQKPQRNSAPSPASSAQRGVSAAGAVATQAGAPAAARGAPPGPTAEAATADGPVPQQGTADAGQPVLMQGAVQDAAGDGQLRAGDGPGKAAADARGEAGGALQAAPGGGGDGVTAERGRLPRGGDEEREDGKLRQPLRRSARSRLRDGREAAAPPQRPEASTDAGPQVSTACTMMFVAKCVCHSGHVA